MPGFPGWQACPGVGLHSPTASQFRNQFCSLRLPGNSRSCVAKVASPRHGLFFLLPCWIILLWGFQSSSNSVFGMKSVVLNLCVWIFCLHICLFTTYVFGAHRGEKRAWEIPEMEYRQQQATRLVSGFEPGSAGGGGGLLTVEPSLLWVWVSYHQLLQRQPLVH